MMNFVWLFSKFLHFVIRVLYVAHLKSYILIRSRKIVLPFRGLEMIFNINLILGFSKTCYWC